MRQWLAFLLFLLAVSECQSFEEADSTEHPVLNGAETWLHWQAPFLSGSGYGSEAFAYVAALDRHMPGRLSIVHHGDSVNVPFIRGLSSRDRETLSRLLQAYPASSSVVEVCHSEPGAWIPALYETSPCPSIQGAFTIGRTMFEARPCTSS